jgi:hypothetical protein
MSFNNVPGDCQPKTGSLLPFGLLIPALIEVFENILELPGWDSGALIGYPDFHRSGFPVRASNSEDLHPNLAAWRRKLQSIAQ